MMFNSYTDIVTMKASNGKILYLTKKDEKITWTYYKKYALKFHPNYGFQQLIFSFEKLNNNDLSKLKIERYFSGNGYSLKPAGIYQTYNEFYSEYEEKGLSGLLKNLKKAVI